VVPVHLVRRVRQHQIDEGVAQVPHVLEGRRLIQPQMLRALDADAADPRRWPGSCRSIFAGRGTGRRNRPLIGAGARDGHGHGKQTSDRRGRSRLPCPDGRIEPPGSRGAGPSQDRKLAGPSVAGHGKTS
jgi:hypothetical protein